MMKFRPGPEKAMIYAPNLGSPPTKTTSSKEHLGNALAYWLTAREAAARGCKFYVRIDSTHIHCSGKVAITEELEREAVDEQRRVGDLLGVEVDRIYKSWTTDRIALYWQAIQQLRRGGHIEAPIGDAAMQLIFFPDRVLAEDAMWGPIRSGAAKVWHHLFNFPHTMIVAPVDFYEFNVPLHIRGLDIYTCAGNEIEVSKALGFSYPEYAHFPIILDEKGQKLEKAFGVENPYCFTKWAEQFSKPEDVRHNLENFIYDEAETDRALTRMKRVKTVRVNRDGKACEADPDKRQIGA